MNFAQLEEVIDERCDMMDVPGAETVAGTESAILK